MAEQAVGQAQARVIEGNLVVPPGARFAVVASRFNHFIVDRLVEGALDAIARHGGALERTSIVRVPGAWEMPTIVGRLAQKKSVDAIVTLGAVIRGSTPHFDYVAAEVTKGIATVSLQTGVPVTFGVLTTDSIEQAIERAGTKHGNKGWEAAVSAIEMLALGAALDAAGL
ncbi:6,7-dimethyl-8-ribityllumazine synthase [Sorangium sp. So ce1014]|uniref:6,7-dimethyl-8-ribityllumazine synthase n=1 Tax=Sorangium sp. So ce1014 TaxID=3133326 RepID=UPI003F5FBF67